MKTAPSAESLWMNSVLSSRPLAHPDNIAAAQREIDKRSAEGEDMTNAVIDPYTSEIKKSEAPKAESIKTTLVTPLSAPEAEPVHPLGKPIKLSKLNPELHLFFQNLRALAVEEKITATSAVHRALDNFPNATRRDIKHAAAAVGINPLTARNTFDRVKNK